MKLYVITVCLNAKTALEISTRSINALRSPDLFYAVSDGDSLDGTKQFLEKAGPLVDQWVSEPDKGIYDAMNMAVQRLPSEDGHVLFLGAGDQLIDLPKTIERQPGAILFGNVQIGDDLFVSKIGWKLKIGNTLHHQGLFYPKAVLTATKFDTRFRIYGDFDLNQRLSMSNIPFIPLRKTIALAEPGGISWDAPQSEVIAITRKNFGLFWAVVAIAWRVYRNIRSQVLRTHW